MMIPTLAKAKVKEKARARVTKSLAEFAVSFEFRTALSSRQANSYTWVAGNINLNRLYFKTLRVFIQAPIHYSSVSVGEILAGMVKGLFASALIIVVGLIASPVFLLPVLLWLL